MRTPPLAVALLVGASSAVVHAQPNVFLQNDSYGGGALLCYSGITNDRGLAARFVASANQYPYTIQTIRVFACNGGSDAYVIQIFRDDGGQVNPGTEIWSSQNAYLLDGNNTFNDIMLSQEPIQPPPIASGGIRVLLVNIQILQPVGFGADLNGILPQTNYVRTESSVWSFAESPPYNVGGDWVLRLGIATQGSPQLSALDVAVTEGTGASADAVFTVALSPTATQPVTVAYATADATATSPADYSPRSGTLTFPPGTGVRTVVVPVAGDASDEPEETFSLGLSNPANAGIEDGSAVGTITDDDAAPTLSVADATTVEGDGGGTGQITFPISLSAASGFPVTVGYATANGTAAAPGDFTGASGTVTFPPGVAQRTLGVGIVRDLQDEADESFTLDLAAPSNATLSDGTGLGTILDDDLLVQQELTHGSRWTGVLASPPGPEPRVDAYAIAQAPYTSYEVVVDTGSGDLGSAGPVLERYEPATSTVVQGSAPVGTGFGRSLRWENASSSVVASQLVRVRSAQCTTDCGADDVYRVRAYDTTLRCSRFNNSGTQFTVLQLQNVTATAVTGNLWFWSPAGALLASQTVALPPHGSMALNTSAVSGLAGQSGSLTLSSDAPYGALAGKAVALEPGTGMSFDAPLEPRPR